VAAESVFNTIVGTKSKHFQGGGLPSVVSSVMAEMNPEIVNATFVNAVTANAATVNATMLETRNMANRLYLDWNATAPMRGEARKALLAALEAIGNPSSIHAEGRLARRLVEEAREHVAALVGAEPQNVVFTSGGTEANMLVLSPGDGSPARRIDRLLVSAVEHPSVLAGGRFPAPLVERIPVSAHGLLDIAALERRLATLAAEGAARPLVSVMLANNETGVLQPLPAIADAVHRAGGLMHADAVQAAGRIPLDINAMSADFLTISGHKIGAPKGVGAVIKRARRLELVPLVTGGGQERGARAGTENVAAIAGFGAAAVAARRNMAVEAARMRQLRDRLEEGLRAATPGAVVFGAGVERLPNTTLVALEGIKAETAVIAFDLEGVAVSSGAACSSGKVAPSHVLAAMGVAPDLARGAIRVSLGSATTENDVESFLRAWIGVSGALLNRAGGRNVQAAAV
jgi:cysteine desulfurase